MEPLQRLLIKDDCRELVLRSAACTDAHDATGLAALFTATATLQRPDGTMLEGRDAIARAYQRRPVERITRHLITNSFVDVLDLDMARVTSNVLLWSGSTDDPVGAHGRPAHGVRVVGGFDDLCTLTAEGWRIAQRRATFALHSGV